MNWLHQLNTLFAPAKLSRARIVSAILVAVAADFLQLILFPLQWTFVQELIDIVAMIITTWLLGFHLLLLPTFAIEFIPFVDMLPTWTGCVVAVITLRKRSAPATIDITAEVSPPPLLKDSHPPKPNSEPDKS